MALMLMAMAAAIVLGMVFRKHEGLLRFVVLLLALAVTTLYYVFPERFM